MDPQQSDNSGEDSAIRSSGNGGFRDRQGQPVNDERIGVCHLQHKAQIVCSGTCKKLYRFLRYPQIFPTRQFFNVRANQGRPRRVASQTGKCLSMGCGTLSTYVPHSDWMTRDLTGAKRLSGTEPLSAHLD